MYVFIHIILTYHKKKTDKNINKQKDKQYITSKQQTAQKCKFP